MTATKSRKTSNAKSKKWRWKLSDAVIVAIIGSVATIIGALFTSPLSEKWLIQTPVPATSTTVTEPTPILGIGSTIIGEDGVTLVYMPEGEFMMGSTPAQFDQALADCQMQNNNQCTPDLFDEEKPQHKVYLDPYYIDQYEVTNARYAECVIAGICQLPQNINSSTRESYYGNAEFDNYPVIYVSWFDANNYCQWRSARLPSEAEWEKAASWNELTREKYVYPWGNDFDGSLVNLCDVKCAPGWADKRLNDGYSDTSPVGNYPKGVSTYGAYDMAGNVWEWVNDWFSETYYQNSPSSNPLGPNSGDTRVLRGGSWNSFNVSVRSSDRSDLEPANASVNLGFRCARSP